jgi:hypothetical protein
MIVMKLPQAGGCHCGNIRYEITEAPQLVYKLPAENALNRLLPRLFRMGSAMMERAELPVQRKSTLKMRSGMGSSLLAARRLKVGQERAT